MPRVVYNLKKIFRKQGENIRPFKQFNYLNLLSVKELKDLLNFSEQQLYLNPDHDFSAKKIFLMQYPVAGFLVEKILAGKPFVLVCYHDSSRFGFSSVLPRPGLHVVRGDLKPLAVAQSHFDLAVLPFAGHYDEEALQLFPEISGILSNGGRLILTVIHPALEILLANQNPASTFQAHSTLSAYASALKHNNLYIETIREGVIDKEARPFFTAPDGVDYYDEFRGIPLVLYIRAVKFLRP